MDPIDADFCEYATCVKMGRHRSWLISLLPYLLFFRFDPLIGVARRTNCMPFLFAPFQLRGVTMVGRGLSGWLHAFGQ